MTGIGGERFDIGVIPTAFVTGEGYRMLFRMLKHGKVEVEIEMTNSFGQHRCPTISATVASMELSADEVSSISISTSTFRALACGKASGILHR